MTFAVFQLTLWLAITSWIKNVTVILIIVLITHITGKPWPRFPPPPVFSEHWKGQVTWMKALHTLKLAYHIAQINYSVHRFTKKESTTKKNLEDNSSNLMEDHNLEGYIHSPKCTGRHTHTHSHKTHTQAQTHIQCTHTVTRHNTYTYTNIQIHIHKFTNTTQHTHTHTHTGIWCKSWTLKNTHK